MNNLDISIDDNHSIALADDNRDNNIQTSLLRNSSVNEIVKRINPSIFSNEIISPITGQDSSINDFLNQLKTNESYNIDDSTNTEELNNNKPVNEVKTDAIKKDNDSRPREIMPIANGIKKDFIKVMNVVKEYGSDEAKTVALNDVSFEIYEGELVIFLGQSGAGKTTALNMIGGMDTVTSGRIIVGDKEITDYDEDELTEYRRNTIGFIFQYYNLVNNLTAKENVELATEISQDYVDARIILDQVGLSDKYDKIPSQLSGGEQQRVAIARAMAKKPKLLLCDEPTGALDYVTGKQVLALLQKTNRENNITTIIITHNQAITPMADKVIKFRSGTITDVVENEHPINVEDIEW